MALVTTSQNPPLKTDPTVSIREALVHFENGLTDDQKQTYRKISVKPEASDVIAFVTQVDNDNQARATRCVASRLSTFLEAAQQFVSVVDTFVSSNPYIAALVWGGIKLAIVSASNAMSYFDKVTSMIMSIGKFCPIYKQFGQLFAGSVELQCALCDYYAAVVRLCTQVIKSSHRTPVTHFFQSVINPFESEFKPFHDELHEAGKVVHLQISLASKKADSETSKLMALERQENQRYRFSAATFRSEARNEHENMRQWRLRYLDREVSKLKSSVRNNLSTVNHLATWKRIYQQRAPCTAEWLHVDPNFVDWQADKRTSVLWCSGTLGVGKTVLASNIIANLQRTRTPNDVICHHFCRAEVRLSLSAKAIIGGLARQMVDVLIENSKDRNLLTYLRDSTHDIEAKQIITVILPLLESDKKYYVVVDGLDESEREDIETVAQSLAELCNSSHGRMKIIYLGRPELEQYLFRVRKYDYTIPVTKSRVAEDVDKFARATLDQCLEDQKLKLSDPTLILQIMETLRGVSEEIFLWTRLFIDEICTQQSDNAIIDILKHPPREVSELVRQKMTRVKRHEAVDHAIKVLRYCGVLKKSLELDEYRELLGITVGQQIFDRGSLPNDMNGIIAACYGLVFVDTETNTVEFVHHSIQQHLFIGNSLHPDGIDNVKLDMELGKLCLTYLNFNDFKRQLTRQTAGSGITITPVQLGVLPVAKSGSMIARAAQKLLRQQSQLKNLSVRELERKTQEILGEETESLRMKSELQRREFCFLKYAQVHWIDHLVHLDPDYDSEIWRMFCVCVSDNNSLSIKPWITKNESQDGVFKERGEPGNILQWCVKEGHHGMLCYLVMYGPQTFTEERKRTIMTGDTFAPQARSIKYILSCTASVPVTLQWGLWHAAEAGQHDRIDIYLGAGVDLSCLALGKGPPLLIAAREGHFEVVRKLVSAGAYIDDFDQDGYTALHTATVKGHFNIVMWLLNAKANLYVYSHADRRSPLHTAAYHGYADIAKILVAFGADIRFTEHTGRTALQMATERRHLNVIIILMCAEARISYDADVNIGRLIHTAIVRRYYNVVKELLVAGSGANAIVEGETALHAVVRTGLTDLVDSAIAAGADVQAITVTTGSTALHIAVHYGYDGIIKTLLAAGANVDMVDLLGRTALYMAVENMVIRAVEELLFAGAKFDGITAEMRRAFDVATKGKRRYDALDKLLTYAETEQTSTISSDV